MRPMTHYRVAVFIEDFDTLPGRWEWATVRGIPFKHYDRSEAESLASFGNKGEAVVIEIPAGRAHGRAARRVPGRHVAGRTMTRSHCAEEIMIDDILELLYLRESTHLAEVIEKFGSDHWSSAIKTRKAKAATIPEQIINNEPRLLESFEVGDVSHQGDLSIVRIANLPASAKPRKDRQLAEGNTQGSRHVLERGKVYAADAQEVAYFVSMATKCEVDARYVGPVFVSPAAPTEHDLTHPEHGHQGFPAGAVCAVVYQRNLDSEEREHRTRD